MAAISLPDGGHAVLHDKLTVAGRRVLAPAFTDMITALAATGVDLKDFAKLDLDGDEMAILILGGSDGRFVAASMDFQAAAVVAFVKEWSYGPPPTMATVLTQVEDTDAFDELAATCSQLALAAMKPKKWGPDGHSDPDSPTVPSSGSEPGGRAPTVPSTPLIQPPSDGSSNTGTAGSFI